MSWLDDEDIMKNTSSDTSDTPITPNGFTAADMVHFREIAANMHNLNNNFRIIIREINDENLPNMEAIRAIIRDSVRNLTDNNIVDFQNIVINTFIDNGVTEEALARVINSMEHMFENTENLENVPPAFAEVPVDGVPEPDLPPIIQEALEREQARRL